MDTYLFDPVNPSRSAAAQALLTDVQKSLGVTSAEIRPLSINQQALVFLQQLDPTTTIYNVGFTIDLEGADAPIFRQALQLIVDRHPALRTVFRQLDDRPVGVVVDQRPISFEVMADLDEVARSAEMAALQHQPFDLGRDPMLRARYYPRPDGLATLQVVVHHVAVDGWSLWLLVDDLCRFVAELSADSDFVPPAPRQRGGDFATWQHALLESERGQAMADFWATELADAPTFLSLPTDYTRGSRPFAEESIPFELDPMLAEELRSLAKANGASLYGVLLAAFQLLLSKVSGQDDVLVGSPVHGRAERAFAKQIGLFVNLNVMRGQISAEATVRDLIQTTAEKVERVLQNQHYPFALVTEQQHGSHEGDRPLVPAALNLLKLPRRLSDLGRIWRDEQARIEIAGLTASRLRVDSGYGFGKLDLYLELFDWQGELGAKLAYDVGQFERATAERLRDHFLQLLANMVADPDQSIGNLSLLSPAERYRLLKTWNATAETLPSVALVHERVAQQANRTPNAIAVSMGTQSLTYAELNRRANQLAHVLRAEGVGTDSIVGICLPRSAEMMVAVLAVAKAGAAYLPLDPSYPAERLQFMLDDANAAIVITRHDAVDVLGSQPRVARLCLDEWREIERQPDTNPSVNVGLDNLAYVIYTSGSTGQPKGVALPHRTLANLIEWQIANGHASAEAKTLQFASLSFDVAAQEIFATWCGGGELVLVADEVRRDPARLLALLADRQIERLFVPFVALQALADSAEAQPTPPALPHLREVITAGEQLHISEAVRTFFRRLPDCTLVNQYGPTESHVVTAYALTDSAETWPSLPPIGRPIANSDTYILDERLQPVPVGVVGELYLGGAGLARGYLNRPELTAEKFIPHPFSDDQTARLYRTGDLARYLPDGNIAFLGRADFQLKVRGYRVEPGEVEAALLQHPAVAQAAVVGVANRLGMHQLVAFVVADSAEDLLPFLQDRLPAYMLPAKIVPIDAMPLTPSGKIDRKALPVADLRDVAQAEFVPPRTPQEALLAEIWSEVLQVRPIGVDDNFFELGGHSLLASQVISRMARATGVDLPMRTLFAAPTVAGISAEIDQLRQPDIPKSTVTIPSVPRDGLLPLSFAQERMWFLHQVNPNDFAYHIPLVVKLPGPLDHARLQQALDALVARHESLRTLFPTRDGQPFQQVIAPFSAEIQRVDLSNISAEQQLPTVEKLVQADLRRAFDFSAEPPWRLTLFDLSDDEIVMVFVFHHIIFDQWSIMILWQELEQLMDALVAGTSAELPPLPIQYADFAVWQRGWLRDGVLDDLLDYWRTQLADLPTLNLPTDRPRPPIQTYNGATAFLMLDDELAEAMLSFSQRSQVSLFMLVFAVFKLLLARYSGQSDIAVGVPVANRHWLDVEPIIGTFVNTLVVRTRQDSAETFMAFLHHVRDVLLDTYAHQEMPFEKLVGELVETRDLSHTPLIQVLFNMVNAPFDYERVAQTSAEFMHFDRGAAQFDLSVTAVVEPHLPAQPHVVVEYNTDLFDAATVERFLRHYEALLRGVVADPQRPLHAYDVLTSAERQRLLTALTQPATPILSACLHELFEAQASQTPDATAIVAGDRTLSYCELDERANQLARHLRELGVGPEKMVGVALSRSAEMVVALLGILKAGGAYLPLDPTFPVERLAYMVQDAELDVVVTEAALRDAGPTGLVDDLVCIDADWPTIASQPKSPLPPSAETHHLAYMIYTSGSTGRPKGVQIEHRNVVNFMQAMAERPGISAEDRLLAITTLSFDISVLEVFLPLLNGATVVVVDSQTAADGRALLRAIERHRPTMMQATPTTWSMLVEAGWQATPSLRKVLSGGEALSAELAQAILAHDVELWNMYGPTETTIWSSVARIEPDQPAITLGQPIANTRFVVLDDHNRLVPPGVAGELAIGGAGVARGYRNRPQLTAERFIADPFREDARLYRTGDLVKLTAENELIYLGRVDFQVKVHGHRIELGEIEALLMAHASVRKAVVTVDDHSQTLVAYLVTHEGAERPTTTALRDHLGQSLPAYMLPGLFIFLDAFPLTPNRKIDRQALPAPDRYRPTLAQRYVAPRTDLEKVLAGILADLLALERVGVADDFFELGGHSLQATRYVARVGQALRTEVSLWTFLQAPTVAALADALQNSAEGPRICRIATLRVQMAQRSTDDVQAELRQRERTQ